MITITRTSTHVMVSILAFCVVDDRAMVSRLGSSVVDGRVKG
jgi:hypothetical protein